MVDTGVVVIGKNEGERLRTSISSVLAYQPYVVYVDSGSRDCSVALVEEMGVAVLELDDAVPHTPARGRNEGATYLEKKYPQLQYLQFLDGDGELAAGWIEVAREVIEEKPRLGIVAGSRREKNRNYSVFTRLLDIEWRRIWEPTCGMVSKTGGDFFVRMAAFNAVGKFHSELIGGEEPELCTRMTAADWGIYKIDASMSVHDGSHSGGLDRIRRHMRFGWTVTEIAKIYSGTSVDLYRRENKSVWFLGIVLPITGIMLCLQSCIVAITFLLSCYLVKGVGTYRQVKGRGVSTRDARLFAVDNCLGLIFQGIGKCLYYSSVPAKRLKLRFGKVFYR